MISMKARFLELQLSLKKRLGTLVKLRSPFSDTFFCFFSTNHQNCLQQNLKIKKEEKTSYVTPETRCKSGVNGKA